MFFLDGLLKALVKKGRLTVIDSSGRSHVYCGGDGPSATIRLHDKALPCKILLNPSVALGEAFMNGRLTVENGDIYRFLDLVAMNIGWGGVHWVSNTISALRKLFRRVAQHNPISRARDNVAHHYDLSGDLYALFLDADRQYSCAYFMSPDDSLETAQFQKKRHIAAKLLLEPGQRVLDIGSGWGGLSLYIAQTADVHVTGVTLSEEQYKLSLQRADQAGLSGRVEFLLKDYRELEGQFDRIVSVGMFEHVGVGYYGEFFSKVSDLLTDDGVALLHSIGRADGPGHTDAWMRKYIFPGGYSPALSEVLPVVERTGLFSTDIEILRLHYAETLRHWRNRFAANRDKAAEIYDQRFCRMWEFYLAASEAAFRYAGHIVFQLQLAKNQQAGPLTRDYIVDWERKRSGVKAATIRAAE